MSKLVVLKLDGDLDVGVRVTLEIGEEGRRPSTEISGQLPPNLGMVTAIEQWRSTYRSLGKSARITAKKIVDNTSSITKRRSDCYNKAYELRSHLNNWLLSESFRPVREKWFKHLMPDDEVRVLIRTGSMQLEKVPWHLWDLIERDYPKAEIGLSVAESEQVDVSRTPSYRGKVRILAILGNSIGINVQQDRQLLEKLPGAATVFLVEPKRQDINDLLWNQPWDILFFAGHSKTEGDIGRIYINDHDSLTIEDLRYALRNAVAGGLHLAIFNSCDCLGLALDLQELHIPQIIAMAEPIPDKVAQEFLKYFLTAFAGGQSLYLAVREARERLQGLQGEFPCASWLPVICQNPALMPQTWDQLRGRTGGRIRGVNWPVNLPLTRKDLQITEIKLSKKKLLVSATIFGLGASVICWHLAGVNGGLRNWLKSSPVGDHLSFGEEILTPGLAIPEEQQGIEAYAELKYERAVDWLQKARKKKLNNPEILIYLNNARIDAEKVKAFTIAVAAPISSNPDKAFEILKGVAQAQNEVNDGNKIHGRSLKVLIADDANNPTQARQIAEELAQSNILAVVGHDTSEITLATMDIYEQHKLVLVSPGSTSAHLPRPGDKFFFRILPTNRVNAQALASYLSNRASQQKAAVFYNPQSDFSKAFQEQFVASFLGSENQIVEGEIFDLSDPFFKARAAIEQAREKGATAIVVIPDGGTSPYSLFNTIKLIKANQHRLWIAGANTVYNPKTLLVGQDALDRLVVVVPWIGMKSPNPEFPRATQTLWGGGEPTSSTASAYDAAQVLIKALETTPNPNRLEVQKILSNPIFEAKGATGAIGFLPNGDRKQLLVELAKVVPSKCSDYGYLFVPVNPTLKDKDLQRYCQENSWALSK